MQSSKIILLYFVESSEALCSALLFLINQKWVSLYTCTKNMYLLKSMSLLNDRKLKEYWVLFFDRIARNPWKNPGVAWKMYKKAVSRQFGSKKRNSENAVSVYQPNISKLKLHHSLHNTLQVRSKTNDLASYTTQAHNYTLSNQIKAIYYR